MAKGIWMAMTSDDLELPIAVADSAASLAKKLGCSTGSVQAKRWKDEKVAREGRDPRGLHAKYRIVKVEVDE